MIDISGWFKPLNLFPREFTNNPHQRRVGKRRVKQTSTHAWAKRKARQQMAKASRRRNRNRK